MNAIELHPESVARLVDFIVERHSITMKKAAGEPKPWTTDPILRQYKFCSVYRELDTETVWIAKNYRKIKHKHAWFAMVIARLVNNRHALAKIEPVPFKPKHFVDVIHALLERKQKAFSGAYIVSTNGVAMDKAEYLAQYVLQPIWDARERLAPEPNMLCSEFYTRLRAFRGMGTFMAGQVVADVKFMMHPVPRDFWVFAVSGPGSRRGLNIICNRPMEAPWREHEWYDKLDELMISFAHISHARLQAMPKISMQDLQNCLCEYTKYYKVLTRIGRPRSNYPGV